MSVIEKLDNIDPEVVESLAEVQSENCETLNQSFSKIYWAACGV